MTLTKSPHDTHVTAVISGTYGTVTFVFEGDIGGGLWAPLAAQSLSTGAVVTGTVSPSNDAELAYLIVAPGLAAVRARVTAIASGTATFSLLSASYVGLSAPQFVSGGTYSGATLSGTTTVSGPLDLTDIGTVAAAGTVQGDATALTNTITYVSAADGDKGVVLPTAAAGKVRLVYNTHASSGLKVYPAASDDINDGTTNAAVTIEGKTLAIFAALDATTWAAIFTSNS